MHAKVSPLWLFAAPVVVLAVYVSALVVPVVMKEVVPAVVKAVMDSL